MNRTRLVTGPAQVFRFRGAPHQNSCQVFELAQKNIGMGMALRIKNDNVVVFAEKPVNILHRHPRGHLNVLYSPYKMACTSGHGVEQRYEEHSYQ